MPLDLSIHWKPVRDPHYVLASIQSSARGYYLIFAGQEVLIRAQELARSVPGQHSVGLLLGHVYVCSISGSQYVVIDALVEHTLAAQGDDAVRGAVQHLVSQRNDRRATEVLGWYCSTRSVGGRVPEELATIHAASFPQPFQTLLVLADSGASSGAFFLHDAPASRWYTAPFYEVTAPTRDTGPSRATCIAWPNYVTTDEVVPLVRSSTAAVTPQRTIAAEDRTPLWRSLLGTSRRRRPQASSVSPPAAARSLLPGNPSTPEPPAPDTKRDAPSAVVPPTAAQPQATESVDTDTSPGDPLRHYVEVALSEGFFVVAQFEAQNTSANETLCLLSEPFSGLLLTIVTDDSQVVDAMLHCNMHTDDARVLAGAFPEHRDLESGTVYVRQSVVDGLRAQCRRLWEAQMLEREWKVTPTIYLLTPSEWELDAVDAMPDTLNDQRIGSLPEPVRRQFGLWSRSDVRRNEDTRPRGDESSAADD
jgi:hypothetical protein